MTNFFCLKWGKKYPPIYVNRLFNSLKVNYNNPFTFHCLTDDSEGLNKDIEIKPIPKTFSEYPRTQIFTSEKMCYFYDYAYLSGKKAWFDLDILIQNNITDEINQEHEKVKFIWNHWRDPRAEIVNYGFLTCNINSSFVAWQDDVGYNLYENLIKVKEKAFFSYPSFDKYIYYQCHRKNQIDFWHNKIAYNYNIGGIFPEDNQPLKFRNDYNICLFNTSHKAWAKKEETQIELHETNDWAKTLWKSYDNII
jgi:hypothetical protein